MKTKLTRIGDSVALLLDEPLLEQAGLRENDEVEVSANTSGITVTPAEQARRDTEFRASVEKITAKYAGLFERLSK